MAKKNKVMRYLFLFLCSISMSFAQADKSKALLGEDTFTDGMKFFVLEDYSSALKLFESFVKLEEKSAVGHYMKSRAELALNQLDKAELSAKTSVDLGKNIHYYLLNYAQILQKNFKVNQAEKVYKELLQLKPEYIEAYFALIDLQNGNGAYDQALKTLNQLESKVGESDKTIALKQDLLLRTNNVQEAVKLVGKSNSPDALIDQANLLVGTGKVNEAIKILEQELKNNMAWEKGLLALHQIYLDKGNEKEYQAFLTQYLDKSPALSSAYIQILSGYYGKFKGTDGNLYQALVGKWEAALGSSANESIALADVYFYQNDFEKAQQYYHSALQKNKNHLFAWERYLQSLYNLGNFKELEKQADNATLYFPNSGKIWLLMGLAQVINGSDAEIAIEEAERLTQSDVDLKSDTQTLKAFLAAKRDLKQTNPSTELSKFMVAYSGKNQSIAQDLYQNNLKIPLYKAILAKSYLADKNIKSAVEMVELLPLMQNSWMWELKGDILAEDGKTEEAKNAWKTALQWDSKNKQLQEKIQ